MNFAVAALIACGCVSLAEGPDWPPADDYINAAVACGQNGAALNCELSRTRWAKDYSDAIAGIKESQRRVSLCLSTGCDHAVRPNAVLGCAWRVVIAGSAHHRNAADAADLTQFCGSAYLDDTGRKAAHIQARFMQQLLAKAD